MRLGSSNAKRTLFNKAKWNTMPNTTIMDRLRAATQPAHAAAEAHPFQVALARGSLPLEQYVANLAQLLHVHATLERRLRDLAARQPATAPLIRADLFQEGRLREDLAHFRAAPAKPLPATAALLGDIEHAAEAHPVALLGFLYVLEGSKNGGRYLARGVAQAYRLTPGGPGVRYLDPHGAAQRDLWVEFKTNMNALPLGEEESQQIVAAALRMFEAISAIGDDVLKLAGGTAQAVA